MNDNEFLIKLWNHIDTLDIEATPTERKALSDLEAREIMLINSFTDKQKELFKKYDEALSELNYVCRQEAFIQGIRFATSYLLDAIQ